MEQKTLLDEVNYTSQTWHPNASELFFDQLLFRPGLQERSSQDLSSHRFGVWTSECWGSGEVGCVGALELGAVT